MKIKKFDVVELKNSNKATILDIKESKYVAEIVDANGKTIGIKEITESDINQVIYTK